MISDTAPSDAAGADQEGPAERLRFSRRQAIGLAVGLGLGSAAATSGSSAQPGAPQPVFPKVATVINAELKPLAPNVYAFVQTAGAGMSNFAISNCGLVAGPDSLLGIDTTAAPVQANRFRAAAERATGKRFRRLVITHAHPDHTLGLQVFDGVDVIAQEACRAQMTRQNRGRPGFWENPAWSDGTEVFRLVLPNVTYSERMTLYDYGPTLVQLMWPGRAHTAGDTIAHLANEKIVFVGDIGFFGVTPLNGSGYVANWIKVCDDILKMDVTTIVPGHGPVGGKAELADMKGYLELIFSEGRKRFDRGETPGRAAAEIDLGRYAGWIDADRIVTNLTRLWTEFGGTIAANTSQADIQIARRDYDAIKGVAK